ncbi:MAG: GTP-binding protein [Candidatus Heimdallarchaeum aukensis]|uniref:GTP-binding protein n=1 Tax=Candidatus Heimdallarchaeum aukensis TaxID=2876573 RepID=A0A9Y1BJQ4_9ARCH|nr:MAG: GTP-binding protein [Candidatus Heimdallarchaeum aukensis]
MSLEPKRAYKIVLIGDPEVGKTSIRRRYMGKTFKGEYLKTIGADFAAQKVEIEDEVVLLTIWDLAGQTIFHGMRSSFYQGCKSALVVFDVTNVESLNNVEKWTEEAVTYAKSSLQEIYLIGNKIDLKKERVVTKEQIDKKVKQLESLVNFPIRVYETSALTGENIQSLFMDLSRRLIISDNVKFEEEIEAKRAHDVKKEKRKEPGKDVDYKSKDDLKEIINHIELHVEKINDFIKLLKKRLDKL